MCDLAPTLHDLAEDGHVPRRDTLRLLGRLLTQVHRLPCPPSGEGACSSQWT
ncbi:hypothetical protein [Nonomuraea ceibae]|uniref:hypothetical protein n=1 Tax=Nonomuraea ceibae TaxID=1935170 RepID=UPI001C5CC40C|nr:hypothetical protein [Nonomuraea ceibae]